MSLDTLIMLAGVFVALLPYLGFPSNLDTVFLVIVGLAIVIMGIAVRRSFPRASKQKDYSESRSPHPDIPLQ